MTEASKLALAFPLIIVSVLLILLFNIVEFPSNEEEGQGFDIKRFSSYEELTEFLKTRTESQLYAGSMSVASRSLETTAAPLASIAEAGDGQKAADYSTTNIQVAGVDEPDIVKTDGKYIYTISEGKVVIVDAYPAESAKIVSEVKVDGMASNIFISGDKLVVFGQKDFYYPYPLGIEPAVGGAVAGKAVAESGVAVESSVATSIIIDRAPSYYESSTFVYIYDVSDRSSPTLKRNISVNGYFFSARMIGDYVYLIATQSVYLLEKGPILPAVAVDGVAREMPVTDIYYFDIYDNSYVYTNVMALNVQDRGEEPNVKTYLSGSGQNLYVSQDNIYMVYTKYLSYTGIFKRIVEEAILPSLPADVANDIKDIQAGHMNEYEKQAEMGRIMEDYMESIGPEEGAKFLKSMESSVEKVYEEIQKESEKTVIHKISVSGRNVEYKKSGDVPGVVLNQFSMDEYDGNFRIATTTGGWQATSLNHVYVLDGGLNVIGKLEDLARTERIFSARFMGDKAYLVTFRRTDPLFVIDLSVPTSPKVAGELKIPGFSEYLHPYDENHLIGLGQEADETGRTTGQIKLSLFDVSDVSNPSEMHKFLIGGNNDYAYSEALNDHKAFLFSKDKSLLIIPASVNNWRDNKYSDGAYVLDLTLESGFSLKGTVTHQDTTSKGEEYYYGDYGFTVRRSLYIDDALYTVSDSLIKSNSLVDLSQIADVNLK